MNLQSDLGNHIDGILRVVARFIFIMFLASDEPDQSALTGD